MDLKFNGKFVFPVPLAYDNIQNGGGQGTIARCKAVLDKLEKVGVPSSVCVVVLTAGYTAKSKAVPTATQVQSLAEQMRIYLEPHLEFRARFIVKPCSWGTQDEIRQSAALIKEYCAKSGIPLSQCVILSSSNWLHLRGRVTLWWRRYMPKHTGAEVIFIEANHSFKPWERVQEVGKLVRDLFRAIREKQWIRIIKNEGV